MSIQMKPKNYLGMSLLLCIACFLLVYPLIFALLPALVGEEADPDKQAVETQTESGESIAEASLAKPERSDGLKVGMYQQGEASYYGAKFHSRKTSSGEYFDMNDMTAAHKSLPFGTVLEVTNLANNKKVKVRVNDRGPFIRGRIIDVSKRAAKFLNMLGTGVAPVEIVIVSLPEPRKKIRILRSAEELNKAAAQAQNSAASSEAAASGASQSETVSSEATESEAAKAEQSQDGLEDLEGLEALEDLEADGAKKEKMLTNKRYAIQIVSYAQEEHAHQQLDRLEHEGIPIHLERFGKYYRLILSGLDFEEVAAYRKKLAELGFPDVLLRQE